MKTLVVAALAALLCTTVTAARADETKRPAPAAEPDSARPEAKRAEATRADPKTAEKRGDAAAKADPKTAEKPCEPVKPCSID